MDVIDYLLQRGVPDFKEIPSFEFFDKFNIIDLIYSQAVLEADLIRIYEYDKEKGTMEVEYLDLMEKMDDDYFIKDIINFYRRDGIFKKIKRN